MKTKDHVWLETEAAQAGLRQSRAQRAMPAGGPDRRRLQADETHILRAEAPQQLNEYPDSDTVMKMLLLRFNVADGTPFDMLNSFAADEQADRRRQQEIAPPCSESRA